MSTLILSKFDVTERQLLQAIIMFFRNEDPVSIHTLAEAASQVLNDIGAKSMLRESDIVKEDKRKEWLSYLFKSRNFFKHADKDKDDKHEFKLEFNDYSLIEGIVMYASFKKQWVPETLVFLSWFKVAHPNLINKQSEVYRLIEKSNRDGNLPNPNDKNNLYEIIKKLRDGSFTLNNVNLKYGL